MNESQNKRNLDFIKSKIDKSLSSTIDSNNLDVNAAIDQYKCLLHSIFYTGFDLSCEVLEKNDKRVIVEFTLK